MVPCAHGDEWCQGLAPEAYLAQPGDTGDSAGDLADCAHGSDGHRRFAPVASAEEWLQDWEARIGCWWLSTPLRSSLHACAGALALHLAERFERLAAGGSPASARDPSAAEPGCEWLEYGANTLDLPPFPDLPARFEQPPLSPRMLLPKWERYDGMGQLIGAKHPLDVIGEPAQDANRDIRDTRGNSALNRARFSVGLFLAPAALLAGLSLRRRRSRQTNRQRLGLSRRRVTI